MAERWWVWVTAVIVAVMPILFYADAHSVDRQFVHDLDVAGINYVNVPSALATGHEVCALLDGGASLDRVLLQEWATKKVTTLDDARFLVESAAMAYCPQYAVAPGPFGTLVPFGIIA